MRPLRIILHHSTTSEGITYNWDEVTKYHKSYAFNNEIITKDKAMELVSNGEKVKRPWKDIGYHFGIGEIGDCPKIIMGRFPYEKGSHMDVENYGNLGILFLGNFDIEEVGDEEWDLGIKLIRYLQKRYTIKALEVYGHRELDPTKTCPGKLFDLDKFRSGLLLI